jgi:hypothetical protein
VVCRCGAQGPWSTTKVKVMRVRADEPGTVKDERLDLTKGPEAPGDERCDLTKGPLA